MYIIIMYCVVYCMYYYYYVYIHIYTEVLLIRLIHFFDFFGDEFRRVEIIREIPREVSRSSNLCGWGARGYMGQS